MSEGRWPLLLHPNHSLKPFSPSPRASARASVKLLHLLCAVPPLPSQSGHETQPSSRYALSGWDGMSEGRCPLLLHAFHPSWPVSPSPRATARASVKLLHATRGIESIVKEWVSLNGHLLFHWRASQC